jgi:hypothetical protein
MASTASVEWAQPGKSIYGCWLSLLLTSIRSLSRPTRRDTNALSRSFHRHSFILHSNGLLSIVEAWTKASRSLNALREAFGDTLTVGALSDLPALPVICRLAMTLSHPSTSTGAFARHYVREHTSCRALVRRPPYSSGKEGTPSQRYTMLLPGTLSSQYIGFSMSWCPSTTCACHRSSVRGKQLVASNTDMLSKHVSRSTRDASIKEIRMFVNEASPAVARGSMVGLLVYTSRVLAFTIQRLKVCTCVRCHLQDDMYQVQARIKVSRTTA